MHAVEGAAAPRRAGARGARASRASSVGPIDTRRGARAPRRGDPRPRRLGAAALARAARRHARPRPRPLDGERRVDGRRRDARRAQAPSSSRPARRPPSPTFPACARRSPWTNREATTAKHVPARLAILGGGVVGVEMAQAYAGLGSHVTLIHRGDRLLAREEPFASEQVLDALRECGVDVRLGTRRRASRADGDGRARARRRLRASRPTSCSWPSAARPARRDRSRRARARAEDGPLEVGDDLRVPGHDWLFASATSTGARCSRTWASTRAGSSPTRSSGATVRLRSDGARSPRVIFTDPQVGAVGLTLAAAQAAGLVVRHVDVDDRRERRRVVHRPRRARHGADAGRRGAACDRRLHHHRHRGRRVAARRHHRGGRRGPARRPLARDPVVPDAQRALARLLEAYGL